MHIDWDAAIPMDDGVVLGADVFRPSAEGRRPVLLSYGPYAKGLAFQEGYKSAWDRLVKSAPEVLAGSSNKYQCWELVDPEKRSEEHTSELQSRRDLVCRLLLEKK